MTKLTDALKAIDKMPQSKNVLKKKKPRLKGIDLDKLRERDTRRLITKWNMYF